MKCQNCGAELIQGRSFCYACGCRVSLQENSIRFCSVCGTKIGDKHKFCASCGARTDLFSQSIKNDFFIENEQKEDDLFIDEPYISKTVDNKDTGDVVPYQSDEEVKREETWKKTVNSREKRLGITFPEKEDKIKSNLSEVVGLWGLIGAVILILWAVISFSESANIALPVSSSYCEGKEYTVIQEKFLNAGFKNIKMVEIDDLEENEKEKNGNVEKVYVDGKSKFAKEDEYKRSTEIIIQYHTIKKIPVNIHIDFSANLLLNRYDVTLNFDGQKCISLSHGKDANVQLKAVSGKHILEFVSEEDSEVKGTVEFVIGSEVNAGYKIKCFERSIAVSEEYFYKIGELGENDIMIMEDMSQYKYKNYRDVEKSLQTLGFTNISTKILYDIVWGITKEGETESVSINGRKDFRAGDIVAKDCPVIITYHLKEEDDPDRMPTPTNTPKPTATPRPTNTPRPTATPRPTNTPKPTITPTPQVTKSDKLSYSTNNLEKAKKGNTGVFAYSNGTTYDVYWIIDFDEGYVYNFAYGNGDESCDRWKIQSGDLNSVLIITWHEDGIAIASWGLHFKWVNQPDILIVQDHVGNEIKFTPTNLEKALKIRNKMRIVDH